MNIMYRQGDLLFIKVDKIPPKKMLRKIDDDVIVRGEASGHAHVLIGGELYRELYRADDRLYIIVKNIAKVVHEEHAPIILEKGFWIVIRQREYTPQGPEHVLD